MIPTPYDDAASRYFYPQYYILNIGDLITTFVKQWDSLIENEIRNHPFKEDTVYPEVYSLAPDGSIQKTVYLAQHVSEVAHCWHPDISLILASAIEAIKTHQDTHQDMSLTLGMLWIDVAHMAAIQLQTNLPEAALPTAISSTRRQIADIAMQFGKALFQRLVEFGLYQHGRFPYHYVGWQDDCAIVALDEDLTGPVSATPPVFPVPG